MLSDPQVLESCIQDVEKSLVLMQKSITSIVMLLQVPGPQHTTQAILEDLEYLSMSSEQLLSTMSSLRELCENDICFEISVCHARIDRYTPKTVDFRVWRSMVKMVVEEIASGKPPTSLLLMSEFLSEMIRDNVQEIGNAPENITLDKAESLRGQISGLTMHMNMACEFLRLINHPGAEN